MGCGEVENDINAPVGKMDDAGMEQQIFADSDLCEPIEIHISCENLVNLDFASKSDPIAILYEFNEKTRNWNIVGKTEMINNNLNPVFVQAIRMKFLFEQQQKMRVEVYDIDDPNEMNNFNKQEFIGGAEFLLSHVMRVDKKIF